MKRKTGKYLLPPALDIITLVLHVSKLENYQRSYNFLDRPHRDLMRDSG